MPYSPIIEIDNILVSSEILTEYFCCNYEQCKGACCVVGCSGAPLKESECEKLKSEYDNYAMYLSKQGRACVAAKGFFEVDADGDLVTPLTDDPEYRHLAAIESADDPCAYTLFDGGSCLCAIEKAFHAGKCSFVKPISCRLYPIRVSTLSNGMTALNLHRWDLCKGAFRKGKKNQIPVYKFLREPIIAEFGEEFYSALEEAAKMLAARS